MAPSGFLLQASIIVRYSNTVKCSWRESHFLSECYIPEQTTPSGEMSARVEVTMCVCMFGPNSMFSSKEYEMNQNLTLNRDSEHRTERPIEWTKTSLSHRYILQAIKVKVDYFIWQVICLRHYNKVNKDKLWHMLTGHSYEHYWGWLNSAYTKEKLHCFANIALTSKYPKANVYNRHWGGLHVLHCLQLRVLLKRSIASLFGKVIRIVSFCLWLFKPL